ncbi:hypothetical protein TNIN_92101 [Trichonephila inaurata madagascariensis]|uniref:Uncharacterized protein n=1 Tax=Trichonephila inaurata madagascariensis TaxID=2747483 RepID=A0A8X6YVY4_9ARAC|nr:hypothetical protein TNIN_92101 [Trichonephila inaurata madagascariensis]
MPLRKRSVRALQMNSKRWRKENADCKVLENPVVSNVRLEKLNAVVNAVEQAVTEAVCEYNKGTVRTIVETQKALGVATGGSTKQLATILDCRKQFRKRRQNTSYKLALKLIKKAIHRKELLAKKREGMTYGAGQF